MSTAIRRASRTTLFHGFSMFLAALFLFPIVTALLNSLKSPVDAAHSPPTWLPSSVTVENYANLATYGEGVGVYLTNSVVVSVITVTLTVVLAITAGFGFARFEFPGKGALFGTTLAVLMVPYATMVLPLYIVLNALHLGGTLIGLGLVLVVFQLPFSVFMMRNSFESVPRELEEAAMVDGCSQIGALRHIALRVVTPGIVTVALFAFLASWNEFLAPLVLLNDGSRFTLPIMLVNIRSGTFGEIDWGALQAGVVVSMLPCLVLYVVLQRFYVSGLVNGALRG